MRISKIPQGSFQKWPGSGDKLSSQATEPNKANVSKVGASPLVFLKLNEDGALFFYLQKAKIGCIICDHQHKVIMAVSIVDNYAMNPETIEVLAILRSQQLCMPQGLHNLIIESDCLLLLVEEITA